jgi:hypothetical protein
MVVGLGEGVKQHVYKSRLFETPCPDDAGSLGALGRPYDRHVYLEDETGEIRLLGELAHLREAAVRRGMGE